MSLFPSDCMMNPSQKGNDRENSNCKKTRETTEHKNPIGGISSRFSVRIPAEERSIRDRVGPAEAERFPAAFASAGPPYAHSRIRRTLVSADTYHKQIGLEMGRCVGTTYSNRA